MDGLVPLSLYWPTKLVMSMKGTLRMQASSEAGERLAHPRWEATKVKFVNVVSVMLLIRKTEPESM